MGDFKKKMGEGANNREDSLLTRRSGLRKDYKGEGQGGSGKR
jgi:hypothetical protein